MHPDGGHFRHIGSGLAQQIRMDIHRLHDTSQNQKELDIFMRRITGIHQIDSVISG